MHILLIDKTRT